MFVQSRRQIWLKLVFICVFLYIAIKRFHENLCFNHVKKVYQVYFKQELESTFYHWNGQTIDPLSDNRAPMLIFVNVMRRYFEQILEWINNIKISEFVFFNFWKHKYSLSFQTFLNIWWQDSCSSKECKLMLYIHTFLNLIKP